MVGGTIDFMPHAGDDHEPAVCNAGDKFFLGRGGYQTVQTGLKDKHRDLHLPGLGRRQGEFSGVDGFPAPVIAGAGSPAERFLPADFPIVAKTGKGACAAFGKRFLRIKSGLGKEPFLPAAAKDLEIAEGAGGPGRT